MHHDSHEISAVLASSIARRSGAAAGVRRGQVSGLSFLRMVIDPALAVIVYCAAVLAYGYGMAGRDLILCLLVFSLMFPGTPRPAISRRGLVKEILAGWLVIAGILVLFGWATTYIVEFPPEVLIAWAIAVPLTLFVVHWTLPRIAPRLVHKEHARTAVVVGANELGLRLARQFCSNTMLGVRFAGYFDDRGTDRLSPLVHPELRGSMLQLPQYVKDNNVGAIFIALPMSSQPRIAQLLEALYDTTASVYFVPDIFIYDLIQARIDDIDGLPVLAVCESPFFGVSGLVKRLEDLILGAVILAVAAPLMCAVALGVKVSSPGPVLFKQRRYGLDGKEIVVYKFRSMCVQEDGPDIVQARRGDPRVTRFGAFIRRTSLDELPQFINVLQGRMSIVGPRPHAVSHNEQYRKLIRGYMIRHKVKPGVTGLAQVHGYRGETDNVDKMKARVELDLEYLRHWSLRLDLAVILKTLVVVITGRNAY